ncbi:MAG: hypothetical protein COB51_00430 [Moraxellaceae bacterium]|nr:MAG: hypothetical protein COB51_00430 [Moraxellaceae bacterium]
MHKTLTEFVAALRNSDVRVSTSETIDAVKVIQLIGLNDKELLRNSLSIVLPKSDVEKDSFDHCFENFFSFARLSEFKVDDRELDEEGDLFSDEEEGVGRGQGEGQGDSGGTGGFGGNQESLPDDFTKVEEYIKDQGIEIQSRLAKMLLRGDKANLTIAMAEAAKAIDLNKISFFTQKGIYTRKMMVHMGLEELETEMYQLEESEQFIERQVGKRIRQAREYLRVEVRDYVERQFLTVADAEGKELRDEVTRNIKLTNIELRGFSNIQAVVRKMAKRLTALHSRRKKKFNRGILDVRKTIRRNVAYDGILFETHWKQVKIDRPKVMVICDVSRSVREVARFLLMFLYSLSEILPNVRAFAFSARLYEVTDVFKNNTLEKAVEETLDNYGFGSTDYGMAFQDFKDICYEQIDSKTTILILGDSRNNYNDTKSEILQEISKRARQVIWLNPEPRTHWRAGDAEMRAYAPYCSIVEECNSLNHLERVVNQLMSRAN